MAAPSAIFISDMHLGARYVGDARQHERQVCHFLDTHVLEAGVPRLYMLGDVIDFWWEYKNVVPRGFTRFFGTIARLTDAGVRVVWFKGNHDIWMTGYLHEELGVEIVDEDLVEDIEGTRIYMAHGDNFGPQPKPYRLLRRVFRNETARRVYSALHPRWGIGIAHKWSSHSRKHGETQPCTQAIDNLIDYAEAYSACHPDIDAYIFGHLHTPKTATLNQQVPLLILGDWYSGPSWAELKGSTLKLH